MTLLLKDGVTHHPKILQAGAEAAWLWVAAIDYARAHLTDGVLPASVLPTLGRFRTRVDRLAGTLVDATLFERVDGGYRVHDYLDHNDSRENVQRKRREDADRKRGNRHADSTPRPHGIHPESGGNKTPSRAHAARVGVGIGIRRFSEGEGEPEREPLPAADNRGPDELWEQWRAAAEAHGMPVRLQVKPQEYHYLRELVAAFTPDELDRALTAWWDAPRVPGRSLGLFRAQVQEVLQHLAGPRRHQPFLAPVTSSEQQEADLAAWAAKGRTS